MNLRKLKRKKSKKISSHKNEIQQLLTRAAEYYHSGMTRQALEYYQKAFALNPKDDDTCNNIGSIFHTLGDLEKAGVFYEKTIAINPENISAIYNLGNICLLKKNQTLAETYFKKTVELNPGHADALNNLGSLSNESGDFESAIQYCRQAVLNAPENALMHYNLGVMYHDSGEREKANICYSTSLKIDPQLANVHSTIVMSSNYNPEASPEDHFRAADRWWEMHGNPIASRFDFTAKNRAPEKKLKLGFVSPDFRQHSVAYFLLPLFRHLNRNTFTITCYANQKKEDETSKEFKSLADQWVNIWNMTDETAARKIFEDNIDILVDLAGHTVFNRLLVFAQKPAPVQISWLGYPNTTGLKTMDYRLTDSKADPENGDDQYYSETLVRMAGSFLCYASPDCGSAYPRGKGNNSRESKEIVFGSFNKLDKLNESVIATWAGILKKVPKSRLLLKNKHLVSEKIKNKYISMFKKHSISPDRLIMVSRTRSLADHLVMYHGVDIALDTFPYNGTTTSCEALWMGTPVISLFGKSHVARVGGAILSHIGLGDELVARNKDDYIQKAVQLAADRDRLTEMSKTMRSRLKNSILCDADGFTKNMEKTFRNLWEKWCLGKKT